MTQLLEEVETGRKRAPVIEPGHSFSTVTSTISDVVLKRPLSIGWLAGVMYGHFAFYAPAFAVGAVFNLLNLVVIGSLVVRQRPFRLAPLAG